MAVSRISGIVSGFDTETMVKDLMKIEQAKIDKVKQQKEVYAWQKGAYKEFSSLLRGLQSEFMDVLKPSSNLRSRAMFNVYGAAVTLDDAASSAVSVKTSANSQKGTIAIDQITQLATADTWTSGSQVKVLEGTTLDAAALASLNVATDGVKAVSFTVDGTTKSIILADNYADFDALKTDLQTKLNSAFGVNKISVAGTDKLLFDSVGSSVAIGGELVAELGFTSGASNVLSTSTSLAAAFGIGSNPVFSVNGVSSASMGIKSTDTIKQLMDKINSSTAGVQVSYSSISDKFTMKSTKEGVANNVELTDTDGFFANSLKLSTGNRVAGVDAQLTIDGVALTRATNTFEIDGTSITLKQTYVPANPGTASDIRINIASDPTAATATVKKFVEKYNELIDKITTKTLEKRNRDYAPLTDQQRKDLSEDEIKLWEEKAKSGLLRSDSMLQGIADKLRATVFKAVDGLGISLQDIGISTSKSYSDNGKLVLDETKFNQALTERPNEVIELFTKESNTEYSDSVNRKTRDNENGWANRINDIFQDQIRLTRDVSGKRGFLIEKAGYEKDDAEALSTIAKRMSSMDTSIATLMDNMANKEELYYARFSRMESMLSQMNSQFSSVFGNMSGQA